MTNSVDPDQTAPSGLFVCATISETLVYTFLGHLPYKGMRYKVQETNKGEQRIHNGIRYKD